LLPHEWNSIWIYFMAPPLGMLLAAAACGQLRDAVTCAKLHNHNHKRCIFCEFHALQKIIEKLQGSCPKGD
jgi:aquaporin Z